MISQGGSCGAGDGGEDDGDVPAAFYDSLIHDLSQQPSTVHSSRGSRAASPRLSPSLSKHGSRVDLTVSNTGGGAGVTMVGEEDLAEQMKVIGE